jgi:hypothetical protein
METSLAPPVKSFAEIRRSLNPCCSYVILANESATASEADLRLAFDTLPWRPGEVAEKHVYRDANTGGLLLVAKLAPRQSDSIKERMLAKPTSPPLTLYYYGRHGRGKSKPFDLEKIS